MKQVSSVYFCCCCCFFFFFYYQLTEQVVFMLMYFLCTFPCFSAWHRTRYLLNTQKNRSSLHQHTRSFLHKHTLNIFVSIYRIILTGGGGSFTEPSTAASRLSFALWTWLEPLSELTEQSWLLHYYLSQKPLRASLFFFSSFSFSFPFFFCSSPDIQEITTNTE